MSGFWCRSGTFGLALVKPEQQAFGSAVDMTEADDKSDITDEPERGFPFAARRAILASNSISE